MKEYKAIQYNIWDVVKDGDTYHKLIESQWWYSKWKVIENYTWRYFDKWTGRDWFVFRTNVKLRIIDTWHALESWSYKMLKWLIE